MATKIRKCLFIGLGGTGMETLLHTKQLFMETYNGKVPPMIGFLGIDTDVEVYTKDVESTKLGKKISLDKSEQFPIYVESARPFYNQNKEKLDWLPDINVKALDTLSKKGAGQVRTSGRFALTFNISKVEAKIMEALDRINLADNQYNEDFEILGDDVEIHMVFSLCGGTGCGTFLNLAYLIQKIAPNCKLIGYGILPNVFISMLGKNGTTRVKPNAFGAIEDLDWLMHCDMNTHLAIQYIKSETPINGRPFYNFYLIDNKNDNGDVYKTVAELAEMVSLSLVIASGELSTNVGSMADNVNIDISEKKFDIQKKSAWVSGMGVCEVIINGTKLRDIYATKIIQRITERLLNSCVDAIQIANTWIDSPDINIRENNNFDNTIDFILQKEPESSLNIDDVDEAKVAYENYIKNSLPDDKDITKKIQEKIDIIKQSLTALIKSNINKECGVGAAENIIIAIQKQISIFLDEMNGELKELEEQHPEDHFKNQLESSIVDLQHLNAKRFMMNKKSKIEDGKNDIINLAKEWAIVKREKYRRIKAISFFNSINEILRGELDIVSSTKKILLAIQDDCLSVLSSLSNQVNQVSQTFQIDLAQRFENNVVINDEEILFPDLMASIPFTNKIYDFAVQASPKDTVKKVLLDYANSLSNAKRWASLTIEDALKTLNAEDLKSVLKMAQNKSRLLFKYDQKGFVPDTYPNDTYFIGVPNMKNTIITAENLKDVFDSGSKLNIVSIGSKDRIIFYRQFGVIPVFQVGPVLSYKEDYEHYTDCDFHFDANFHQKMIREGYSIEPKKTVDDSIEWWVKGLIFGLVKNENGKYYYKNQKEGKGLQQFWVELSPYRDESFQQFSKKSSEIRDDYEKYITDYCKSKGDKVIDKLYHDVKEGFNYVEKYSQVNMSVDEINNKRENEKIAQLMEDEINFVNEL